jgi:hypothetical protein
MALPDPTQARFPSAAARHGMYESFYLRAVHPELPRGVWIRYTVHKRAGAEPMGSVWFTLFDAEREGPRAAKITLAGPRAGGKEWIGVGENRLGPEMATGEAGACAWELRFQPLEGPLFHLPRAWMYGAPAPRTKLLSPAPLAQFSGRLEVDREEIAVEGWPGMLGHNWGAQHAERWIWLHGLGFDGAAGAWLDAAIGRIKVGDLTTPWIANGALSLDGTRHALGGPARVRRTAVRETPERCDFLLPGRRVSVQGTVSARRGGVVGWVYADPDGSEHHVANCSIADMRLLVSRSGGAPVSLEVAGAAAYELGMRERDHGVALQPFPDG